MANDITVSRTYRSKTTALRIKRRLYDHGLLAKLAVSRGSNELTVFVPARYSYNIDNFLNRLEGERA